MSAMNENENITINMKAWHESEDGEQRIRTQLTTEDGVIVSDCKWKGNCESGQEGNNCCEQNDKDCESNPTENDNHSQDESVSRKPAVDSKRRADFLSAILGFVSTSLDANDGVMMDAMESGALGEGAKNFAEFIKENPGNRSLWKRPFDM